MATIPISDGDPKNTYTATAGQTIFPYTFWVKDKDHIAVYVNDTLKTRLTDYTVSAIESPTGANIVFNSGLSEDDEVAIIYDPLFERTADYTGTIRLEALNTELTYILTLLQSNQRKIDDALKTSDTETVSFSGELPSLSGNGGKVLALNSGATAIEYLSVADATVVGNYDSLVTDGNNSDTVFALGFTPATVNSLLVEVDGTILEPTVDYTISGTDITFTTAPSTGTDNIVIRNLASGVAATTPADNSVSTAKIQDDAVTSAKIADGAVTTAKVADNAVTLAKLEDGTQGDVLYYGSSGAPARLGAGTAGQLLQTGGAGSNPSWTTVNVSSGLVLLGSATASNSTSIDIHSGGDLDAAIDSTYDWYIIAGVNIVPGTDATSLILRTSTDTGTSFDSAGTDYRWCGVRRESGSTTVSGRASSGDGEIMLHDGSAAGNVGGEAINFIVNLYAPSSTNITTLRWETSFLQSDGQIGDNTGSGIRNAAEDVDGVRLLMDSGNIGSGEFYLYGVKKS